MQRKIIVNDDANEMRVALMEEGRLMELYVQRSVCHRFLGNIYKGRVENVLPGMQAAFIDIGTGKNAFLYRDDALPGSLLSSEKEVDQKTEITDILRKGQEIIVQIEKEPTGTKGARVTTQIALAGRYTVFMPYSDYVGVSRRIVDETERERLKRIVDKIRLSEAGIIVRTAAQDVSVEQIEQDYKFLKGVWQHVLRQSQTLTAPCLLYQDLNLLARSVRDLFTEDTDSFIVDRKACYDSVCDLLTHVAPHLKERVQLYEGSEPIFKRYQIEGEIERSLRRKVWLKSGGYIVIDAMEALTAIDVNTGKFVGTTSLEETVLKINLEAAREIARQIRLRDIGGMIIIDFIDMPQEEHRKQVLAELESELKRDRTRTQLFGWTQLGLVEMTRKKNRQSLDEILRKPCPSCEGTGKTYTEETIAIRIERELKEISGQNDKAAFLIEAHPSVAAKLIGPGGDNLIQLEKAVGKKIYVKGRSELSLIDYRILEDSLGEIEKWATPVYPGQVLRVYVEEPHEHTPRDGIARIEGFILNVSNGGRYVGQKVIVKVRQVFRTYAKATLVDEENIH
jgi:ribonuclease G